MTKALIPVGLAQGFQSMPN